jgi:purine-binding chemotaxis protein CheW
MHGRVIPVFNIRKRFGIPDKEISPDDYMIVAKTSARTVSFTVENIEEVMDCPSPGIVPAEAILPEMEYVEGVLKLDDGMVFIHDLEKFLSPEEDKELDDAIRKAGPDR